MGTILLYVLAAALYGLLAFHFWRTRWRARPSAAVPAPAWERGAVLAPLALHTLLLYESLFNPEALRFGFGYALSVMLWLAVVIYWVESLVLRVDGMQALVLPLAAVSVVLPAIFPGFEVSAPGTLAFRLHLILAMVAYSLFTIAAVQALMMAILERRLHAGAMSGPFASLPPLLTLERTLFRILWIGFIILSLTLVSGIVFSEQLFGKPLRFEHKSLFAILSWVIFGALLVGRHFYGWRGRTAVRWIFSGFITLLLAYIGSRFVLEVILQRAAG
jgi:ABC-type uncharacterized transport system permease subunit